jgi:hypothetical protein
MADARDLIALYSRQYGIDPEFAMRIAGQESGLNQDAVSPVGATGVMQLMPDTARGLGVDPNTLEGNIEGGIKYFAQQLARFGSPELALAAYNAGPGAVEEYGGIPPYDETQNYVSSIMNGYTGQVQQAPGEDAKEKLRAILSGNKNYDMQGKLREILASRQPQQDSYANIQRTSGGRTIPTISSRGGADRGAIMAAISRGQDWEQPLLMAKQLIDTYRAPSVWDSVPRDMETVQARQLTLGDALGRDELAETTRHNQATEEISRLFGGSSGGGGSDGSTGGTLAERTAYAEGEAQKTLYSMYNKVLQDETLGQTPFVAAVETIREFMTNPTINNYLVGSGASAYNVLDGFVRSTTEFPTLEHLTQYIGGPKQDARGNILEEGNTQDPLYKMLDLVVKRQQKQMIEPEVVEPEEPSAFNKFRAMLQGE